MSPTGSQSETSKLSLHSSYLCRYVALLSVGAALYTPFDLSTIGGAGITDRICAVGRAGLRSEHHCVRASASWMMARLFARPGGKELAHFCSSFGCSASNTVENQWTMVPMSARLQVRGKALLSV